ncbi:hypothetical protein N7495_002056 [Penicillium taxi]|uniref:uncharacterized protein n=1 Tax=Penicillium taxi TaxID=168475 RepID=UPI0025457ACF|nr:uncharacterized protein N7495_002056 [Penicillium taxi]KAJ5901528.1 hypothetical protein N7495_002056 [Penicillium taxi]
MCTRSSFVSESPDDASPIAPAFLIFNLPSATCNTIDPNMVGEAQNTQKRRRLPFKPPSRTASAGSSVSPITANIKGKGKAKAKQNTQPTKSSSKSLSKPANAPNRFKRSRDQSESESESATPRPESPRILPATPSELASDDEAEASNNGRERSPSQEADYILAEIITKNTQEDVALEEPAIPPKLITKLLHHHFQNEKTRISKDADAVMGKYIDIFVREAIARAALERNLANGKTGKKGLVDNFLEVEDLEMLTPQLIMDF